MSQSGRSARLPPPSLTHPPLVLARGLRNLWGLACSSYTAVSPTLTPTLPKAPV